jgi:hypothetical protein
MTAQLFCGAGGGKSRYTIRYYDWQGATVYDNTDSINLEEGRLRYVNQYGHTKELWYDKTPYRIDSVR